MNGCYLSVMKGTFLLLLMAAAFSVKAQSYFQQRVDTKLDVRLDDQKHYLHSFEEFTYTNNSPDTLTYIYVHLWPNAYLHDHTQFAEQQVASHNSTFYYSKLSEKGYIDSLDISINGQKVSYFNTDEEPDVARVDLPSPLLPGATLKFATPFRVKIPKVFSRMGHSRQAYYISQWFPKPAVYDRKGWHPLPYLDQGEFYSEIGSYDVQITLPRNYVVMATGNCLDESENQWLDSLSNAPLPTFTYPSKITKRWRDSINRIPPSSAEMKTLHFQEDNIHDFAFFADKRFIVRKDTAHINGGSGTVMTYAAFLPSSKKHWIKGTDYIKETIERLSNEVGPYPYKTAKAVEGDLKAGGGMEYPTVTVIDGHASSGGSLMTIIVHEVGHNWFYGILASNERDHPWMDEGINSFYERKLTHQISLPDTSAKKKGNINIQADGLVYAEGVAAGIDQPFNLPSMDYTTYNYGSDVYLKTALHLEWLEGYIGQDAFRAAMHEYFDTWKHRHPSPEDFMSIMRKHTDKPLDWFFNDAMNNDRRVDFAVRKVQRKDHGIGITLKNRGPFAAPVRVNAYREKRLIDSVWTEPFAGRNTVVMNSDSADFWSIGTELPDVKTTNNTYSKHGPFHGRGIRPALGFGFNRARNEKFYLLPALGYNTSDGFMAGLLLHNLAMPENHFRFAVAPMYGFNSKEFIGTGTAGYFIHPAGATFQEIAAGVEGKTFDYDQTNFNTPSTLYARYFKIAPYVSFTFKNSTAISPVTDRLMLKGYFIHENYFDYQLDISDSLYKPSMVGQQKNYGLLRYTHQNNRLFNPFSYTAEAQFGADFAKLTIECNLRIDYNKKGKSLYIRAFAGKFITINNTPFAADRYWLNSTYTGVNDYLYDDTYIARSERDGIFRQTKTDDPTFRGFHQVSIREGGLKIPTDYYATPLGRSDDWLASLNLKTDLPLGKIPLRLYLDVATFANADKQNPSGNRFLYSGGFEIHLLHDVLLINVPVVYSKDYTDYLKGIYPTKRFANTISFTLQLKNIDWLRSVMGGLRLFGGV